MTLIKPAARVGIGQNKALKTTPLKWPPHGMQHAKMPHGSLGISRLHLNGAYIYVGLHVYWYYVCMYVFGQVSYGAAGAPPKIPAGNAKRSPLLMSAWREARVSPFSLSPFPRFPAPWSSGAPPVFQVLTR